MRPPRAPSAPRTPLGYLPSQACIAGGRLQGVLPRPIGAITVTAVHPPMSPPLTIRALSRRDAAPSAAATTVDTLPTVVTYRRRGRVGANAARCVRTGGGCRRADGGRANRLANNVRPRTLITSSTTIRHPPPRPRLTCFTACRGVASAAIMLLLYTALLGGQIGLDLFQRAVAVRDRVLDLLGHLGVPEAIRTTPHRPRSVRPRHPCGKGPTFSACHTHVWSKPSGWKMGSQPKSLGPRGGTILPCTRLARALSSRSPSGTVRRRRRLGHGAHAAYRRAALKDDGRVAGALAVGERAERVR